LNSFGVVGINNVIPFFNGETRKMSIQYDIQTIYSPSFQGEIQQSAGSAG